LIAAPGLKKQQSRHGTQHHEPQRQAQRAWFRAENRASQQATASKLAYRRIHASACRSELKPLQDQTQRTDQSSGGDRAQRRHRRAGIRTPPARKAETSRSQQQISAGESRTQVARRRPDRLQSAWGTWYQQGGQTSPPSRSPSSASGGQARIEEAAAPSQRWPPSSGPAEQRPIARCCPRSPWRYRKTGSLSQPGRCLGGEIAPRPTCCGASARLLPFPIMRPNRFSLDARRVR